MKEKYSKSSSSSNNNKNEINHGRLNTLKYGSLMVIGFHEIPSKSWKIIKQSCKAEVPRLDDARWDTPKIVEDG